MQFDRLNFLKNGVYEKKIFIVFKDEGVLGVRIVENFWCRVGEKIGNLREFLY